MNTIKKLPQEVINRIAAGEVIQRPLSAIKEMIENSIDANSSMISIFCVDGGFSSIEINDDGNGVPAKDFPLLCERFATSKITDFTDLMKINSFGFRGEALASISFVSHLTIKSKTIQDNLGFQASFRDGIMLEDTIESISMNKGTIINVEKLFYNLGIRKESFTHKEEFKEILKLVHKLSIHHYNIKFKLYSSINNIEFSSCNLLSKGKNARIELISNIYKFNEKSLISTEESISKYSVKIESVISEVGSVKKNRDVIIFINDRFIECDQIKKTVDSIYKSFWVSIHEDEGGYFCYISLSMRTENIDVNVDPRKKFVKFLFANEICDEIKQIFEQKLKEKCSIKVFQTVSLPKNFLDTNKKKIDQNNNDIKIQNHRPSDKFLIRVDPKTQKLTSFLNSNLQNSQRTNEEKFDNQILMNLYNNKIKKTQEDEDNVIFQILSLKKETSDEQTTKFFHNLTYVGCINSNFILVQKDQSLLIINTIPIWYHIFLFNFDFFYYSLEIFTHISLISIQKYEEFLIPEKINIRKSFENILSQQELNENVKNQIIQVFLFLLILIKQRIF